MEENYPKISLSKTKENLDEAFAPFERFSRLIFLMFAHDDPNKCDGVY